MKKSIKFYSEGSDWSPGGDMPYLLNKYGFEEVRRPDQADLVVFNGGADIATEIYDEKPIMRRIPREMSKRDAAEVELFQSCLGRGVFMLGICRGAQLINCLSGGSLWQHVDGHGSDHDIIDLNTKHIYTATSTHHQQMIPGPDGQLIAVANISHDKLKDGKHKTIPFAGNWGEVEGDDAEIVWYPKTRSLCIQGHPEYVPNSDFARYCIQLIKNHYEVSNVQARA